MQEDLMHAEDVFRLFSLEEQNKKLKSTIHMNKISEEDKGKLEADLKNAEQDKYSLAISLENELSRMKE